MPDSKPLVKLLKGAAAALKEKAIDNGSLYVTTDKEELYVDLEDKRIKINDDSFRMNIHVTTPNTNP